MAGRIAAGARPEVLNSPAVIPRFLVFLSAALTAPARPVIEAAGTKPEFSFTAENVSGLSGLTWCRDDLYYAVSDRQKAILPLRIALDRTTGLITAVKAEAAVPLKTSLDDFEDIAWDAAGGLVFISAEKPAAIAGFTVNGRAVPPVNLPPAFRKARRNLSMESLTKNAAAARAWAANEDTLPADGPVSSPEAGGVVRLQEFDAAWKPLRQFAWRTERSGARFRGSGSGITGLCLLDDGSLIVMERVIIGLTLEVRLFLADFSGAADTSRVPSLSSVSFMPAQKHLLYHKAAGLTNWEGLAAGPLLTEGSRSLILAADSGDGTTHSLLALKVKPDEAKK